MKNTSKLFKALVGGGLALLLVFVLVGLAVAQSWTELTPTGGSPTARMNHSAIYDSGTNRMITFGGRIAGCCGPGAMMNDVWVLQNANGLDATPPAWTLLNPGGVLPSQRMQATSVYDPATNRMTVFGGNVNVGFCGATTNETWVLENANGVGSPNWIQLFPTGGPPPQRFYHSAFYDPASNRMIMYGGNVACPPPYYTDVWVLENANGVGSPNWIQLSPTGGSPPSVDALHVAAYDKASNRMIVWVYQYGYLATSSELWVLEHANGLGGSPNWIQLAYTGTNPTNAFLPEVVYDSASNQMVLFGTLTSAVDDVWVLENANGLTGTPNWTLLSAAPDPINGSPSPRDSFSAVWDTASKRMTVFAGRISGGPVLTNDVWVLVMPSGANNPPVAQCTNVTVDADATCKASASIDNGSYDPDGDPITITQEPVGSYGLGDTVVTLMVTDDSGESDSCTATVTVEDNSCPTVTAKLVPVKVKKKKGCFRVELSVADNCDENPQVVATINGTNGADVVNGQLVELKHKKKFKVKEEDGDSGSSDDDSKSHDDDSSSDDCGTVKFEGPVFTLTATAIDNAGNIACEEAVDTFIFVDDDSSSDD